MSLKTLNHLIEPAVSALGYELVGCELSGGLKGRKLLRVYVDGPNGVTLDACASISRQIGAVLEVEDPIRGAYYLEVSSPGLERPLFTLAHYQRFIGRRIKVRLRMAEEARRNFAGVLTAVEGEELTLTLDDGEQIRLAFCDIEKGNLVQNQKSKK